MPGSSRLWRRSKAIELARSTRVVHDSRRFNALEAIELIRSTLVAQDPRRFMAFGVIEANRTLLPATVAVVKSSHLQSSLVLLQIK